MIESMALQMADCLYGYGTMADRADCAAACWPVELRRHLQNLTAIISGKGGGYLEKSGMGFAWKIQG